eukprot:551331_1
MIKEPSRPPSLFERVFPIMGVLCAICVMFVVVVVICISVSAQRASSYDAQPTAGLDHRQADIDENAGNPFGGEMESQRSSKPQSNTLNTNVSSGAAVAR